MTEKEENTPEPLPESKCEDCGAIYGYSLETMGHCCKCWVGTYDGNSQCGCS